MIYSDMQKIETNMMDFEFPATGTRKLLADGAIESDQRSLRLELCNSEHHYVCQCKFARRCGSLRTGDSKSYINSTKLFAEGSIDHLRTVPQRRTSCAFRGESTIGGIPTVAERIFKVLTKQIPPLPAKMAQDLAACQRDGGEDGWCDWVYA